MKAKFLALALLASLAACGDKTSPVTGASAPAPAPTTAIAPVAEPEPQPQEAVLPRLDYPDLASAIDGIKPQMTDTTNEVDEGAIWLALWSREHLNWTDLQALKPSKASLVMKDADTQRGLRLCPTGYIGEITADDSLGTPKVFTGGLIDNSGQIYRFIAVKSTGEIVKGSTAKFCGIVTGRLMFSNSVGGTTHAVSLVGMFDLPENRK